MIGNQALEVGWRIALKSGGDLHCIVQPCVLGF